MRINFNSLGLNLSGGTRFIFELTNRLVDLNHHVTITHLGDKNVYSWFPDVKAEVINVPNVPFSVPDRFMRKYFGRYFAKYGYGDLHDRERRIMMEIPDCDFNVATFSITAYPTYYSHKGRGIYLVQHYEPWFFPDKPSQERAKLTYSLPLKKLCVSQWLTKKVGGVNIGNGINLQEFKVAAEPKVYDVMVIKRQSDWKGDYDPVIEALSNDGLKVFVVNEKLSEEELIKTYNSSRLFLFLSKHEGFGYPPLEAMACGVPVVTTPCLEYATHLQNAYVLNSQYTKEEVLATVLQLLKDDKLYVNLRNGGLQTAQKFDFQKVVHNFLEEISRS